jgi:hypothetical protein
MRKRVSLAFAVKLLSLGIGAAAIVKELRKAKEDRRWHGKVAGIVPYDFRLPTPGRVKDRMWDPDSTQILQPQAWGVGWTINFGRLLDVVRGRG